MRNSCLFSFLFLFFQVKNTSLEAQKSVCNCQPIVSPTYVTYLLHILLFTHIFDTLFHFIFMLIIVRILQRNSYYLHSSEKENEVQDVLFIYSR